jgi:hypothetical protein
MPDSKDNVAILIDYQNIAYFRSYAAPEFEIEYLVLVTSQFGERKLSVYGFGHEKGKHYPTEEELRQQIEERRRKEIEKLEREKAESEKPPSGQTESAPPPPGKPESR